jgi:hypothetical protein
MSNYMDEMSNYMQGRHGKRASGPPELKAQF